MNLPDGRPQPSNVSHTRKADISFDIPAGKAESIPTLNHAALIVQIVGLLLRQSYDEGTVGSSDRCGIIPFQVVGRLHTGFIQDVKRWKFYEKYPIMEINRLPVGVIPRIEGTTVSVKFIRENEDHFAAILIGL